MHVYNCGLTGKLNKHQLKTEATRRKLLSAALRVFSRDGFERSRLEDIASAAGHTRGAFYAHFATKEDLFITLLEYQASKRIAEIAASLRTNTNPESRYQALRDYYLSRAGDRQWNILILEFKLYILRNKKHRANFAAASQRIRESFQTLSPLHAESNKYPKILLGVVLNGLLLEHACDPKRISSSEVNHLLGRMFDLIASPGQGF